VSGIVIITASISKQEETMATKIIPDPALEPTINAARAATILGLHPRSVYLAIERGEIPAIRVGKAVRIPTARFLAKYGPFTTTAA
jgi:excisionase family DNA binding protein